MRGTILPSFAEDGGEGVGVLGTCFIAEQDLIGSVVNLHGYPGAAHGHERAPPSRRR